MEGNSYGPLRGTTCHLLDRVEENTKTLNQDSLPPD
jgi:hypothetical protein